MPSCAYCEADTDDTISFKDLVFCDKYCVTYYFDNLKDELKEIAKKKKRKYDLECGLGDTCRDCGKRLTYKEVVRNEGCVHCGIVPDWKIDTPEWRAYI